MFCFFSIRWDMYFPPESLFQNLTIFKHRLICVFLVYHRNSLYIASLNKKPPLTPKIDPLIRGGLFIYHFLKCVPIFHPRPQVSLQLMLLVKNNSRQSLVLPHKSIFLKTNLPLYQLKVIPIWCRFLNNNVVNGGSGGRSPREKIVVPWRVWSVYQIPEKCP